MGKFGLVSVRRLRRFLEDAPPFNAAGGGGYAGLDNNPPVKKKSKVLLLRRKGNVGGR